MTQQFPLPVQPADPNQRIRQSTVFLRISIAFSVLVVLGAVIWGFASQNSRINSLQSQVNHKPAASAQLTRLQNQVNGLQSMATGQAEEITRLQSKLNSQSPTGDLITCADISQFQQQESLSGTDPSSGTPIYVTIQGQPWVPAHCLKGNVTASVVHLTAYMTRACPVFTCSGPTLITDLPNNMGTVFGIEDNEGLPAGHNALMFFVNGYRAVSVNPVCAASAHPYLANQACLGGGTSDGITGGHPVLALSPDNGKTWQVLSVQDIIMLHKLEAIALARGWRI